MLVAACISFELDDRRFRCDGDPTLCADGTVCGSDGYCAPAAAPDATPVIDAAAVDATLGEVCGNSLDDDGDGDIDCADTECPEDPSCGIGCACGVDGPLENACLDTFDNDADGLTDCLDADDCPDVCQGATECCSDGACRVSC